MSECCYAECRKLYLYDECRYAKSRYDQCRGAITAAERLILNKILNIKINTFDQVHLWWFGASQC